MNKRSIANKILDIKVGLSEAKNDLVPINITYRDKHKRISSKRKWVPLEDLFKRLAEFIL